MCSVFLIFLMDIDLFSTSVQCVYRYTQRSQSVSILTLRTLLSALGFTNIKYLFIYSSSRENGKKSQLDIQIKPDTYFFILLKLYVYCVYTISKKTKCLMIWFNTLISIRYRVSYLLEILSEKLKLVTRTYLMAPS